MIPNCSNCKYSTIIGLDLVCDGEKEPYKVSPIHYCEDWKANLETIADSIRQMSDQELATLLEIVNHFAVKKTKEDWLYWLRSTQRIGNALH